jgi:hypothetical protein
MTWFSKPKQNPPPVAPALCARCRERPGTVLVNFIAAADAPRLDRAEQTVWLCDACLTEIRRHADDN